MESCCRFAVFLCVAGCLVFGPRAALADERMALVIGNAAYVNTAPLANPQHDAQDVSKALADAGFQVTLVENATKRQFDQAMEAFSRRAVKSDAALVYFAGHGMQFEGRNYVIRVDHPIPGPSEPELRDDKGRRHQGRLELLVGREEDPHPLSLAATIRWRKDLSGR